MSWSWQPASRWWEDVLIGWMEDELDTNWLNATDAIASEIGTEIRP